MPKHHNDPKMQERIDKALSVSKRLHRFLKARRDKRKPSLSVDNGGRRRSDKA